MAISMKVRNVSPVVVIPDSKNGCSPSKFELVFGV